MKMVSLPKQGAEEIIEEYNVKKLIRNFADKLKKKELFLNIEAFFITDNHGNVIEVVENKHSLANEKPFDKWNMEALGCNAIGLTIKNGETSYVETDDHALDALKRFSTIAVPIFTDDSKMIAVVGCISNKEHKEASMTRLKEIATFFELLLSETRKAIQVSKDLEKKSALLTISKTLYSTIDVNEVLAEAINTIRIFYPNDSLEILMTQDIFIPDLPISQLTNLSKNNINTKAFMEGRIFVGEAINDNNDYEMAIPLKGKQGIYGVINMVTKEKGGFSEEKINFISNLAEIISSSFENAKLYQQSINLVKELQILNELTKRLNQSLDRDSIFQFVVAESVKIFNAQNVYILRADENLEEFTIIAANNEENIGLNFDIYHGYMGLVYKKKEPLIVADIKSNQKIEDELFNMVGGQSLIAAPIISEDKILGVLAVSSEQQNHFSFDDFKMLQVFSQHLGLTLANAFLHERIQRLAVTDYLTKLYNRSYLDDMVALSVEKDRQGSLLLFDIDDFKEVNDTFGHQTGDQVLVQIAKILQANTRKNDIAARWGGEEIALYLPNVETEVALKIAERITLQISEETEPKVTVSCGVAAWNIETHNVGGLVLFREADQALYQAKHNGKNQVQLHKLVC